MQISTSVGVVHARDMDSIVTARAHNKAKNKWEAVLRDALWRVAVDLCPKMTDDEFEDIWRGFLEIRRLKGME
jgi:hypothetical protein